ncbi:MAG: hypothetical protein FJ146_19530 [Deltaproteobacteria bacterium]|nr:hypothetical protein [Deltaproteobacteria bacterium]
MSLCEGCRSTRSYICEQFSCSKRRRLCDIVDKDLLEDLYFETGRSKVPMDLVIARSRQIEANYSEIASQILAGGLSPPSDPGQAYSYIGHLCARLSHGIGIKSLGRIRTAAEIVTVDQGRNEFEGVPGQAIETELARAWSETMVRIKSARNTRDFAAAYAYIMVELFRIHPFRDGNGRTTRLLLMALAHSNGMKLRRFAPSGKDRRRYRDALLYAHRRRRDRPGSRPEDQDCFLVRDFIARHLTPAITETVEIEPDIQT